MELKLIRLVSDNPHGTPGVLLVDGYPLFTTLERPWLNNTRSVSCIPPGGYICNWTESSKAGNIDGWLIGIDEVPERSLIRMHVGNTIDDSAGCILIGAKFDKSIDQFYIQDSRVAHNRFLKLCKGQKNIPLTIINSR